MAKRAPKGKGRNSAKKSRDEAPRYVRMTNVERRNLLGALDGLKPEDLKGRRGSFMRVIRAIEFTDSEQAEIEELDRQLQVANRGMTLASTSDEVDRWRQELEELRETLTDWEVGEETIELSKPTITDLLEFSVRAPLTGLGVRRVQPLLDRLGEARDADGESEYLRKPNGKAQAAETHA